MKGELPKIGRLLFGLMVIILLTIVITKVITKFALGDDKSFNLMPLGFVLSAASLALSFIDFRTNNPWGAAIWLISGIIWFVITIL